MTWQESHAAAISQSASFLRLSPAQVTRPLPLGADDMKRLDYHAFGHPLEPAAGFTR